MQISISKIVKSLILLQLNLIFSVAFGQNFIQPDITADKSVGCAPEAIKFTVTDAPENSFFTWIINNDTINGKSEQSYIFANGGSYDVSVLLTVPSGKEIKITKPGIVKLGKSTGKISLSVSNKFLCNGTDTVSFTAFAKGAEVFDWIIDGTNYLNTGNKITHRFKTGGYKKVTIRVKDSSGCYGLKVFDSAVYIATPPSVNFTADKTSGCLPLQVNYNAIFTKGNSNIIAYKWMFPGSNNITSNSVNPTGITYTQEGEYDVILTITTKDGCNYTANKKSYIKAGTSSKPSFTANKNYICPGDTVIFTNTTNSATGNKFSWNFSGGKILPMLDSVSQPVVFPQGGSYSATLTYNNGGCMQYTTINNIVEVQQVKAEFTADHFCGCSIPNTVNFINQSTGGINVKYNWTFFDTSGRILSVSKDKNPSFTYTNYGKYKVKLQVTSITGCTDVIVKENFLEFWPLDSLIIKYDTEIFCPGEPINFIAPEPTCGVDTLYKFDWTFYDKNSTDKVLKTASGRSTQMAYFDTAYYSFKLKITSPEGCVAEKIYYNHARVVIVKPDFIVNTNYGCKEGGIILKQSTWPSKNYYLNNWELVNNDDERIVIKGSGETFKPVFPKPGVYSVKYTVNVRNRCIYTKEVPDLLKISGISGDFTANVREGCAPFTTTLNAKVLENIQYQNSSNIVKYEWSAVPAVNVKFSSLNKEVTDITLTETGSYTITLKITNNDGCESIITKSGYINAGVKADFGAPSKICYKEAIKIKNQSGNNAVTYKWTGSAGVKFSADNVAEPVVSLGDKGKYTVSLKVTTALGCTDSISKTITVERVKAVFISKDTLNTCAPAYVSFTANRIDADSFYWYFGDGEKLVTSDTNVAHVYKNNSGDANDGFDVMLVVKNNMGCTDTLIRKKYIKVVGPVPAFSIANSHGCEPLKVEFRNESKNTLKWYLDYNDFSRIDSQAFGPKIYTIKDPNAEFEVFKPRLLAKDKFGCSAWANPNDSVVVYRRPKAGFIVDNNKVCQNETVTFTQTSEFAVKFYWDFNNDGIIDNTEKNPEVVLKPGIYSVKLKVVNRFGCGDSTIIKNVVEVQPAVNGKIETASNIVCNGSIAKFSFVAEKPELIKKINWYINGKEVEQPGTSNNVSFSNTFNKPGNFAIEALVESNFGCVVRIPMSGNILVPDTNRAVTPPMQVVTVENNKNIKVSWSASTSVFFKKYRLFRKENENFIQVYESESNVDTVYTDLSATNVNASSYTYRLQTEDICSRLSFPGITHSSIVLNLSANEINQLLLSWSAYKGWETVEKYNIYRSENGVDFTKYAEVNGDENSYADNNVCDKEYYYYVDAVKQSENLISISNISKGKPDYKLIAKGENIVYASVINDNEIEVKWNATEKNVKHYIIDRFENGSGWISNYASTTSTIWIDNNAQVHHKNYTYRIRIQNECGYITEAGTIGRNILLKARVNSDRIKLNWNSYAYWSKGVMNYQVEILGKDNQWKHVATVASSDTAFTDYNLHEDAVMPYNYRVVAIENVTKANQSVSNTVNIILPSKVFVPNAFTPNNDSRNDDFKAKASFINEGNNNEENSFKFMIFDRWGEKLFESNKLTEGWDGTYKGVAVPEGTYIYIINAMGYDHQAYYLKGTFHLLK